jgi:hypothetical protein
VNADRPSPVGTRPSEGVSRVPVVSSAVRFLTGFALATLVAVQLAEDLGMLHRHLRRTVGEWWDRVAWREEHEVLRAEVRWLARLWDRF